MSHPNINTALETETTGFTFFTEDGKFFLVDKSTGECWEMGAMLAKKHKSQNPTGMYMSEKLDGVRAIWTGEHFLSRNGNVFHAPEWFTQNLPNNTVLDGELWEDRGLFQTTVGKVRSANGDWSNMKFMTFDVINNEPVEARMQELNTLDLPKHCQVVEQIACRDQKHLDQYMETITGLGGEGVMLRKAGSYYEGKRSASLLKVKQFKSDEAVVIGHQDGRGKHEGRLGALLCEYMGKTFKVGSGLSDALRELPPTIGSIVTFSYFETTNAGIPRFPTFLAVRDYE